MLWFLRHRTNWLTHIEFEDRNNHNAKCRVRRQQTSSFAGVRRIQLRARRSVLKSLCIQYSSGQTVNCHFAQTTFQLQLNMFDFSSRLLSNVRAPSLTQWMDYPFIECVTMVILWMFNETHSKHSESKSVWFDHCNLYKRQWSNQGDHHSSHFPAFCLFLLKFCFQVKGK